MKTRYHMNLSVRGALKRPKRMQAGMFTRDDGKSCTADEARDFLLDQLSMGREVLPVGTCDNFDYSGGGCQGHPVEETA